MKTPILFAGFASFLSGGLQAQTPVGDSLPETLGFTQAAPSTPLQNLEDFDFLNLEGEVAVIVYHASW